MTTAPSDDGSTIPVQRSASSEEVSTSLELHVRSGSGQREIVPVRWHSLDYRLPSEQILRFRYQDGTVTFKDLTRSELVYKDGVVKTSGRLEVGSWLEVGEHRILLWDNGAPAAFLKGCSAPYSNELWALGPGEHTIGRPGKRRNAISLDHPTVSREHARLVSLPEGGYAVVAEAATNPVYLRGRALSPAQPETLHHGDLLEIGDLVFRFHQPRGTSGEAAQQACLQVLSLGSLTVRVAGTVIPDKAWRTQYVKWLFAHLAYAWDRPLGTESLIDELWPEADPEKARNNFKFTLSTLRQVLRSHLPPELQHLDVILRSSSTLQLNPDLLDRHDAVTLSRLVKSLALVPEGQAPWERQAQEAILQARGPFLSECYLDWAVDARQTLELQLQELARSLLERLERAQRWDAVIAVASHLLELDRYAQWALVSALRALRQSERRAEALRLWERTQGLWQDEGLEPEAELQRELEQLGS